MPKTKRDHEIVLKDDGGTVRISSDRWEAQDGWILFFQKEKDGRFVEIARVCEDQIEKWEGRDDD